VKGAMEKKSKFVNHGESRVTLLRRQIAITQEGSRRESRKKAKAIETIHAARAGKTREGKGGDSKIRSGTEGGRPQR